MIDSDLNKDNVGKINNNNGNNFLSRVYNSSVNGYSNMIFKSHVNYNMIPLSHNSITSSKKKLDSAQPDWPQSRINSRHYVHDSKFHINKEIQSTNVEDKYRDNPDKEHAIGNSYTFRKGGIDGNLSSLKKIKKSSADTNITLYPNPSYSDNKKESELIHFSDDPTDEIDKKINSDTKNSLYKKNKISSFSQDNDDNSTMADRNHEINKISSFSQDNDDNSTMADKSKHHYLYSLQNHLSKQNSDGFSSDMKEKTKEKGSHTDKPTLDRSKKINDKEGILDEKTLYNPEKIIDSFNKSHLSEMEKISKEYYNLMQDTRRSIGSTQKETSTMNKQQHQLQKQPLYESKQKTFFNKKSSFEPKITININKIEIQAISKPNSFLTSKSVKPLEPFKPKLSLAEYLKKRREGSL